MFNYLIKPTETDPELINYAAASYLFLIRYVDIYSLEVIPTSMSFYKLVNAGHKDNKVLRKYAINYNYGHFGKL